MIKQNSNRRFRLWAKRSLQASAVALATCLSTASAQVILEDGHVDLDFNYRNGAWTVGIHHFASGTHAPGSAVMYGRTHAGAGGTQVTRPGGTTWDFTGVEAGQAFYVFPQTEATGVVWPGFASEDTSPGTFASYSLSDPRVTTSPARWMSVHLRQVEYFGDGVGHFSLWSTGAFGAPTVWMSTVDGITDNDTFFFLEGGHTHMNWGFSDIGYYRITLETTAFLNDGSMTPTSSGWWTFDFGIGTTVIPEPQVLFLLGLVAMFFLVMRRRRARTN